MILSPLRRTLETYVHSDLRAKRLVTSDLVREYANEPSSFLEGEDVVLESEEAFNHRVQKAIEFIRDQHRAPEPWHLPSRTVHETRPSHGWHAQWSSGISSERNVLMEDQIKTCDRFYLRLITEQVMRQCFSRSENALMDHSSELLCFTKTLNSMTPSCSDTGFLSTLTESMP